MDPRRSSISRISSRSCSASDFTSQRRLRLTFRAQTRKQAEAWQKKLHAKLVELLGPFPASSPALNAQTLEVREFPGYRREKFVFESSTGLNVLGYLLTPSGAKPPYATVICVPGHGRGVHDIIGV